MIGALKLLDKYVDKEPFLPPSTWPRYTNKGPSIFYSLVWVLDEHYFQLSPTPDGKAVLSMMHGAFCFG